MSTHLADLLRRYERERVDQQTSGREFSQRFPAEAASLGLTHGVAEHPQTQALLDAISFSNARTQERLDKNHEQLTRDLLSALYPQAGRPLPPFSIAHFDTHASKDGLQSQVVTIPRGTQLFSTRSAGTRCQFRTCFDLKLAPLTLLTAGFSNQISVPLGFSVGERLSGDFSFTICSVSESASLNSLDLQSLRVFIDADPVQAAALRDCLFMRTHSVWLQAGLAKNWVRLEATAIRPVGFAEVEAVIPIERKGHPAHRLLQEYFAYPEKFNFLDIDLAAIRAALADDCQQFTVHCLIRLERREVEIERVLLPLSKRNFLLGCTPVVNLFSTAACPVYQDYTKTEYALLANAQHPADYEVYSVDSVTAVKKSRTGTTITEFHAYYSLKHGLAGGRRGQYWFTRYDERLAELSPGFETYISFVDIDFDPLDTDISAVSIELTCTNRDLATQSSIAAPEGDLSMAKGQGSYPIRMLRRPTAARRFPAKEHWRLISHLSVNLLSLAQSDLVALKELLGLYDMVQSAATQGQIGGMVAIESKPTFEPYRSDGLAGKVFGTQVTVTIDEDAYAGSGLHAFVQLLDHVFGLSVHLNTFVRLVVRSQQTGKELIRCPSRSGYLSIL